MIRRLTKADRELYLSLSGEFFSSEAVLHPIPEEYRRRTFEELMRSDVYALCFILEVAGAPAGYALLSRTFSQEAGGLAVWLEELYIRPEFRSKGLGTEFIRYMEKEAPAARYRLEIEPENTRARALYLRHGFRELGYAQMIKE